MMSIQRITWDHYQTYEHCPQWYCWDYLTPKPPATPGKDTQYMIRGTATQAVVDEWARNWMTVALGSNDAKKLRDFLAVRINKAVEESWVADQHRGRPQTDPLDMIYEIQKDLLHTLPILKDHMTRNPSLGIVQRVIPQAEVEVAWERGGPTLYAKLDLRVEYFDQVVIYEGKSTSRQDATKDTQVRWQAQILHDQLRNQGGEKVPADQHYFVFYRSGDIRPVPVFKTYLGVQDPIENHLDWLKERDRLVRRMLEGDVNPTPSSYPCHICNHRPHCPDHHKPKKKTEPALPPPPRGTNINIL